MRVTRSRAIEGDRHVEQVADAGHVLTDLGGELAGTGGGKIADAEPHQMVEHALLITGDDVVADLCQHDRLAIGGETANGEGGNNGAANPANQLPALAIEDLVDDVAHDPRAEGGGGGNGQHAGNRDQIVADIVAAVFREDAANDRENLSHIRLVSFQASKHPFLFSRATGR